MILHVASMAALFVDQLAQVPVQIQCVQQSTQESWLKQWIPTAVSLLSVGIGVWIASRSIRKNRELTLWSFRATSERDHKRWVLDQKKSEWGAILSSLTVADVKLPHVFDNVKWPTMCNGMLQDLRNVLPAMRNTIFIADALDKGKLIDGFRDYVSEAAKKIKEIEGFTENINQMAVTSSLIVSTQGAVSSSELVALNKRRFTQMGEREKAYQNLHDGFHEQADRIRKVALQSLLSNKANDEPNSPAAPPAPALRESAS